MSFQTYRKYQTPLMIAALVFTVAVFVLFPSFGDLDPVLGGDGAADVFGEFEVATTGETRRVTRDEFFTASREVARLRGRNTELSDDDVWASLMMRADAEGAGLRISDREMQAELFGGTAVTAADYERFWRSLNFGTSREFEIAFRNSVLEGRWRQYLMTDASVVDADAVYEQYKGANERFDFDVVLVPDLDPDQIDDPGDETLREAYDSLPEATRDRLYATPARKDLVHAWRELDAATDGLSEELLAGLPEITDATVEARYARVKSTRWPDEEPAEGDAAQAPSEGPTDAQRAELELELTNIELVAAAAGELQNLEEGVELTKELFLETAGRYGLQTADPEGLLGPEELEALQPIGDARLGSRLRLLGPGDLHHLRPFLPEETLSFMAFVEDSQDPEPLAFEDARDQVFDRWKSTQGNRDALVFLDALDDAARLREEGIAAIEELTAASAARVEERLAEEGAEALVVQAEEATRLEAEIDAALAPLRHLVFAETAQALGYELRSFEGVPRSFRRLESAKPAEEQEDSAGLDYFVKTGGWIFGMGADQVSDSPFLHGNSDTWVLAHVRGVSEPSRGDMFADREGMLQARGSAQQIAAQVFQLDLSSTAIVQAHGLRLAVPPEPTEEEAASTGG